MKALDKRIAARLLAVGDISEGDLEKSLREFDGTGTYQEYLLDKGYVTHKPMARAVAQINGFEFVDLAEVFSPNEAITRITAMDAWKYEVLPLSLRDNVLTMAMGDPNNVYVQNDLRIRTGLNVDIVIAERGELYSRITHHYGPSPSGDRKIPDYVDTPNEPPQTRTWGRRLEDMETMPEGVSKIDDSPEPSHRDYQRRMRELRDSKELIGKTSQFSDAETVIEDPDITTASESEGISPHEAHAIAVLDRLLEERAAIGAHSLLFIPLGKQVKVRARVFGPWYSADSYAASLHENVVKEIRRRTGIDGEEGTPAPERRLTLKHGNKELSCSLAFSATRYGTRVSLLFFDKVEPPTDPGKFLSLPPETSASLSKTLLGSEAGAVLLSAAKADDLWHVYEGLFDFATRNSSRLAVSLETSRTRSTDARYGILCKSERALSSELEKLEDTPPDFVGAFRVDKIDHLRRALELAAGGQTMMVAVAAPDATAAEKVVLDTELAPELAPRAIAYHLHVRCVPLLCQKCCQPIEDRATLPEWAIPMEASFYEAVGCDRCEGTGYTARTILVDLSKPIPGPEIRFKHLVNHKDSEQAAALAGEIDPREAR